MLAPLDEFYLQKEESLRGCLLALRDYILAFDQHITAEWKYKMPFFYYKGKMFCYLWVHKKHRLPYVGIVKSLFLNHPNLILEKRAKMKIMLINPNEDLPIDILQKILREARNLYL